MANNLMVRLVPEDARYVRGALQNAAVCSEKNFLEAHFVATAHVVAAVAMAVVNSVVYLGIGAAYFAARLITLNGRGAIEAAGYGLGGSVQSLLFVVVGVVCVVGGFIFPRLVFLPFKKQEPAPGVVIDTTDTTDFPTEPIVSTPTSLLTISVPPAPPPLREPEPSSYSEPLTPPQLSTPPHSPSTPTVVPTISEPIILPPLPQPEPVFRPVTPPKLPTPPPSPSTTSLAANPTASTPAVVTTISEPLIPPPFPQPEPVSRPATPPKLPIPPLSLSPKTVSTSTTPDSELQALQSHSSTPLPSLDSTPDGTPAESPVGPTPSAAPAVCVPPLSAICNPPPPPILIGPNALQSPPLSGSFTVVEAHDAPKLTPTEQMTLYVQRHCAGAYGNEFEGLIAEGKRFVADLRAGRLNNVPLDERRKYMAPFVWYLMSLAEVHQGKGFKEGMLVFQDPEYRMHDFFAAAATGRESSHYRGSRLTSFGMDIVQDGKTGLPGNHQTAHFGKRLTLDPQNQYTYLKPEAYGTESIGQMVGHALDYLKTRIPHLLGHGSKADECKEHVPPALSKQFLKLCGEIDLKDYNPKLMKDFGVAAMGKTLDDYLKVNPKSPHAEKIAEFVVNELEDYDLVRTGREVVLEDIFTEEGNKKERDRLRKVSFVAPKPPAATAASAKDSKINL